MKTSLVLGFAALFVSQISLAQESQLDKIYEFLRQNVAGKTFNTSKSGELDQGKLSFDFERDQTYAQVERTDSGLRYQFSWAIRQKVYAVVNGTRQTDQVRTTDRLGVSSCELGLRKSTGLLSGYCRVTFNKAPTANMGVADMVSAKIVDGVLEMQQTTVGYNDFYSAQKSGYRAGKQISQVKFEMGGDSKLAITEKNQTFDVNPDTLEKIPGTEAEEILVNTQN